MTQFTVELDPASLRKIEGLRSRMETRNLLRALLDFLEQLAPVLAGVVIEESLSGNRLRRRSGDLARSTVGQALIINGLPGMKIGVFRGPALAYAGIQETGGEIRPKNARALAIPQEPVLTAAGDIRAGFESPRGLTNLRFLKFDQAGGGIGKLVDEDEARAAEEAGGSAYDARAWYILATKATIPASHWLSAPIVNRLPWIGQRLTDFFLRYFSGLTPQAV